jgi:hypothetical protein
MPETKTTAGTDQGRSVTNADMLKQIRTSNLAERHKAELADLVSAMTADEKRELLRLIDESNKLARERAAKLAALDEEYKIKMGDTVREESGYERGKSGKSANVGGPAIIDNRTAAVARAGTDGRARIVGAKKHTLRNAILAVCSLVLIVAGILVILNYL